MLDFLIAEFYTSYSERPEGRTAWKGVKKLYQKEKPA